MTDPKTLDKHIKHLHSRSRLIGWELRRMAVHALVKDGSAEAMDALADTLLADPEQGHFHLAQKAVLELAESGFPQARDAICRLFIGHKHPFVRELVFENHYLPDNPSLRAPFIERLIPFILSRGTTQARQAFALLQQMAAEEDADARNALCEFVIKHDHPQAFECVASKGYTPENPYQRAVFYVLTAQWKQYEDFDFTRNFLQTAYKAAEKSLQDRLSASARQGGRSDILALFAAGSLRTRRTIDKDWAAIIEYWRANERWEDLWQLLQSSPVRWGMRIISILRGANWSPGNPGECELFTRLATHTPSERSSKTVETWLIPRLAVVSNYADLMKAFSFTAHDYIQAYSYADNALRLWTLPDEMTLTALHYLADIRSAGQQHCAYRHRMSSSSLQGHRSKICCFSVGPNSLQLASGDEEGKIYLWSTSGSLETQCLQAHPLRVNCLCFSSDGAFLLSGGADNALRLWDLHSQHCLQTLRQWNHYSLCLALSPDNRYIVSGDSDMEIRVWAISEASIVHRLKGHSAPVTSLAISPDGQFLLSGSEDCSITLWDLSSGTRARTLLGAKAGVTQVLMSPDGKFLVSASRDRMLRIWELPSGRILKTFDTHSHDTTCIALSPDGRLLLQADTNKAAYIWAINRLDAGALQAHSIQTREFDLIQERLQEGESSDEERCYLNFLMELLRWQKRFDIELGDIERDMPYEQFDIEIA